jgi:hypothetical protein
LGRELGLQLGNFEKENLVANQNMNENESPSANGSRGALICTYGGADNQEGRERIDYDEHTFQHAVLRVDQQLAGDDQHLAGVPQPLEICGPSVEPAAKKEVWNFNLEDLVLPICGKPFTS